MILGIAVAVGFTACVVVFFIMRHLMSLEMKPAMDELPHPIEVAVTPKP